MSTPIALDVALLLPPDARQQALALSAALPASESKGLRLDAAAESTVWTRRQMLAAYRQRLERRMPSVAQERQRVDDLMRLLDLHTKHGLALRRGALLDADIAASFTAGPDSLPGDAPPPVPALGAKLSGAALVLTWPADATGYVLESASSLGAGAQWSVAPEAAAIDGGNNKVTVTPSEAARFYRLRH